VLNISHRYGIKIVCSKSLVVWCAYLVQIWGNLHIFFPPALIVEFFGIFYVFFIKVKSEKYKNIFQGDVGIVKVLQILPLNWIKYFDLNVV